MTFKQIAARIKGVSFRERILFTKNLALIIKAGMSLPQGLATLSEQSNSALLKEAIKDISDAVNKGENFSDGLQKYPSLFNEFYVSMIQTGEIAGNLEEILNNLATHMEKERSLRSRVLGALMYPVIILCVMVIVVIIMMIFVVPQLAKVFQDFHAELPATTKIVLGLSNFIATYALFTITGLLVTIFVCFYILTRTQKGKRAFHWLLLKTPIINNIAKKINTARIARTLQALIRSGVGIVQALSIASGVVKNVYYKEALRATAKEVEKGKTLHELLARYPKLFTPLMLQLVAVGEETGSVEVILDQLATSYEEDVDVITKNLPSIIEPLLMIFIGASVGFFAISMLQPIYSITSSIH